MKSLRKEERAFVKVDLKTEGEYSIVISNQKDRNKPKHVSLALQTTLARDLFDKKMGRDSSSREARSVTDFKSQEELEEY